MEKYSQNNWSTNYLNMPPSFVSLSPWVKPDDLTFHQQNLAEIIGTLVEKLVNQKLTTILEQHSVFDFRQISNSKAKKEIISFLTHKYEDGIFQINLLDIIVELKLPASQVEKIMFELEEKGKVNEL